MTLQVQVVSPEKVLWSGEAQRVITRTLGGGDIAFMTGHTPFMGALGTGVTEILRDGGEVVKVAVHAGFVEVSGDRVTLLSDTAELSSAIDVSRAQAAKRRAEEGLGGDDDAEARAALARADARLRAVGDAAT